MNNNFINKTPMYKILILGESNVGKTSLKVRYVDDTFPIDYKPTIGVDYKIKLVNISPTEAVKLSIWDTAGQERFRSIAKSYLHNTQGVLLCYDITDRNSFNELNNYWLPLVFKTTKSKVFIVGNKIDKKDSRKVLYEEAKKVCDKFKLKYFETSSLKNLNIEELFLYIAKEVNCIYDKEDEEEELKKTRISRMNTDENNNLVFKKKSCC